jgi:hypothetical protein
VSGADRVGNVDGSTHLFDGLVEASKQLVEYRERFPNCRTRILLLSDGADDGTRFRLSRASPTTGGTIRLCLRSVRHPARRQRARQLPRLAAHHAVSVVGRAVPRHASRRPSGASCASPSRPD